jgi:hypothetical protein
VLALVLDLPDSCGSARRVRVSEKIELTPEPAGGSQSAGDQEQFHQYVKALSRSSRPSPVFNPECQWLITVKLVVKPKSKVIELTLDQDGPRTPIMTTTSCAVGFKGATDAYKEAFKSVVNGNSRATSC